MSLTGFLLMWLIFSVSVFLAAKLLPFVHINGFGTAVAVAAVYGLLKFLFYYLLVFLSFPLIALTLGLFLLVINAFLLWMTDKLMSGFKVDSFFHTLIASLVITLLDMLFRAVVFALI